ncbi:hypothetical protein [Pseudomonas sp. MUP55]|uniref:hypothetical protein n=1 Tax=Pseudomonas sp. MUP55 TaxID=3087234 RepID=UPI002A5AE353|nr:MULTISPECIES: hypothetical protein [unclassified Pseudomonas]WPN92662.1 hypothetical protein SC319_26210 [Pseudomonas sp. MUP56]WPN98187.1 hypothetical protein SC318_26205 [Pseudomonas sp. MUP55]
MQKTTASPKFLHGHHNATKTKGSLSIAIGMIPLPPFEKFSATENILMRYNEDYLEVRAYVDDYPHLSFWILIHTDDLYDAQTLPVQPDGIPGTAYAGFMANELYNGNQGQLVYCYDEATQVLEGTLHFDASPYRFTGGKFRIKGLNPPVR